MNPYRRSEPNSSIKQMISHCSSSSLVLYSESGAAICDRLREIINANSENSDYYSPIHDNE